MGGTAGIQEPLIIWHQVTGGAGTVSTYTATRAGTIQDVRVIGGAALGGGTMIVGDATGACSDAIAMDVADTLGRATTLDPAHATIAAGGAITFTRNAAGDLGNVLVFLVPSLADSRATT